MLIVKINNPESVPPAEMVGDHQYREPLIIKIPIHIYPVKFPFGLPNRIKLKEIIYEEIMSGPVDHS
jgi:hypothetical protein